jgi:hypothetical protein
MNYTAFTTHAAYADYTDTRFGKVLRIRNGRNETIARVEIPKDKKVTGSYLVEIMRENGYTMAGGWLRRTGCVSAALNKI